MAETHNYKSTANACYMGLITQAAVNNLAPLLFLILQDEYAITLGQITFVTTFNFLVQLFTDAASAAIVRRLGARVCTVGANVLCMLGLIGLSVFPEISPDPYAGLVAAVFLYAVGSGLLEILMSPIVENIPSDDKAAAMSLLHSFYCWGVVAVVILSTGYLYIAGKGMWHLLPVIWAILPAVTALRFTKVPLVSITGESGGLTYAQLFKKKHIWLLAVMMIAAGASELSMSQWASAFAENALNVSKTVGDLAGPCMFALLMGVSRAYMGKQKDMDIPKALVIAGLCCTVSYLVTALSPVPIISLAGCGLTGLFVGIMWPAMLSIAFDDMPGAGPVLPSAMAVFGNMGSTSGPAVVGAAADAAGGDLRIGLLAASLMPLILCLSSLIFIKQRKKTVKQ